MRKVVLGCFSVTLSFFATIGAQAAPKIERQVLSRYRVSAADTKLISALQTRFEIVDKTSAGYDVLVPRERATELMQMAPEAELIAADDLLADVKKSGFNDLGSLAGYRSIDEVYSYLMQVAGRNPGHVQISQYGSSDSGRPLYVLKISDNVASDEDEPEIMLTSATHGDELITVEMLLGLVEKLVTGYGKDQRITSMIQDREIFIIPVVNADGFASQSRYANGVDPNRNYPWPGNENVSSVACIKHLIEFFKSREIVGSIDFHASGELIMYPWAYTYDPPAVADERRFKSVGEAMAGSNNYEVGQISRIIYVAQGSSADYWYWSKNTLAFGIEIAQSKVPSTSEIPRIIEDNRESTWKFLESF